MLLAQTGDCPSIVPARSSAGAERWGLASLHPAEYTEVRARQEILVRAGVAGYAGQDGGREHLAVTTRAGRGAVLVAALTVISVALVACSAGVTNPISNNALSASGFVTPNPAEYTPTPTFPPFTIGAWPSSYSPAVNDTITIYVIVRVQDKTMMTPPLPPSTPVQVVAELSGPISATLTGTTGKDGIAAIPYVVNDPYVGQPVLVTVTANYQNQTYVATTFFTSGVSTAPTATPKSGAKGTPTPTP
jgi:hypothetical protein